MESEDTGRPVREKKHKLTFEDEYQSSPKASKKTMTSTQTDEASANTPLKSILKNTPKGNTKGTTKGPNIKHVKKYVAPKMVDKVSDTPSHETTTLTDEDDSNEEDANDVLCTGCRRRYPISAFPLSAKSGERYLSCQACHVVRRSGKQVQTETSTAEPSEAPKRGRGRPKQTPKMKATEQPCAQSFEQSLKQPSEAHHEIFHQPKETFKLKSIPELRGQTEQNPEETPDEETVEPAHSLTHFITGEKLVEEDHPWTKHIIPEPMHVPNLELPPWNNPVVVIKPAFCCPELELVSDVNDEPSPHERRLFNIICYLTAKGNYVHRHSDKFAFLRVANPKDNPASSDVYDPNEVQISPNYPQISRPNFVVSVTKMYGEQQNWEAFVGRESVDGTIRARPAVWPLAVFGKGLRVEKKGVELTFACNCPGVFWRFRLDDIYYVQKKSLF